MKSRKTHKPIRTCVSCGKKRDKDQLIRMVCEENKLVVFDRMNIKPGRGSYVCKTPSCREQLLIESKLERAFRRKNLVMEKSELIAGTK